MTEAPVVAFGLPLYNSVDHVEEALGSLLAQSLGEIAVVIVDDGSVDGTADLVRRIAGRDARVHYERNPRRLGLVGNWRRCYRATRARHPRARYFAWASDHDHWDPRWAALLAAELDAHPEAVLAYPLAERVAPDGTLLRAPWRWDTAGRRRRGTRLATASWRMMAGDMVYGLLRPDALERCGVFRPVLLPDRLLLAEMAAQGEFRQVPELLWRRRMSGVSTAESQRRSFFPEGAPAYLRLPWWLQHAGAMAWALGVRGSGRPAVSRPSGLGLAAVHGTVSAAFSGTQAGHRLAGRRNAR